jgi:hypothetical protein
MPAISPSTIGAPLYTVTGSKAVIADLSLEIDATGKSFTVRYPAAAVGVQVRLMRGASTLDLLPGPVSDAGTFAGRQVTASTSPAGANTELFCLIQTTGATAIEAWSVRVSGLAGGTCEFEQTDNDPTQVTVTRIMCDPVAAINSVAPPSPVREQQSVTITAALATGPAATPTVVGGPAPAITYRFTYTGTIAIPAFPSSGASQLFSFTAPGVYGSRIIQLTVNSWYDAPVSPGGMGFLNATSAAQPLTINPRTQHLLLVLDRSGSMLGPRWENAKTAGRILAQLFSLLRTTAAATADRVGIEVFEDSSCNWRPFGNAIDPLISLRLAFSDPAAADAAICPLDLGPAGACTPIGDALYRGMQLLNGLGVADDPRFTIILLTDGYENSGTIRVDPSTPVGGLAVSNFSSRRNDFPNVNSRLSLYSIGLGATVQEDVLDALPLPIGAGVPGIYRHVTDVSQLKAAIAEMVSFSQEAQEVVPLIGSPTAPESDVDPGPLAQQRYLRLDPKVNRLAIAVEWTSAADTLELARRDWNGSVFTGAFQPVAAAVKQCPAHGFVGVDVAALFGGDENLVPATEWRLVHRSGGSPVAIPDTDLLAFVDLHVKAEISFDRTQYRTGDAMVITARIRAGDQPIRDGRVTVELARPGESLGTFLASNAAGYQPPRPGGADPAAPKQAMLQTLLRRTDRDSLPILRPSGFFADGTSELWDDGAHGDGEAGDGNYANRFEKVDREGTYTWRFFVQGRHPDGSPFNRLLVISKWVGIAVDPASSPFTVVQVSSIPRPGGGTPLPVPPGQVAVMATVVPKDRSEQFLGPFRTAELHFATSVGALHGDMIDNLNGSYSQVVLHPRGATPKITVKVQGKEISGSPVATDGGCLGKLLALLRRLLRAIFG